MANEVDKNKQKEQKEKVKSLETAMKSAFKEGHFDVLKKTAEELKTLDPENHLAKKLLEKVKREEEEQEMKKKAEKIREYEMMLKKLYKEGEIDKLIALAKELKQFDPKNKASDKWAAKGEKVQLKAKAIEEKKQKKEAAKAESGKKTGSIFEMAIKKDVTEKKEAPVEAPAPSVAAPAASVPAPAPVVPAIKLPQKSEAEKKPQGNIFTKMFQQGEEKQTEKSIIDTIVAKTDEKKPEKAPNPKAVKIQKPKEENAMALLTFSKVFMNFTAIFIVLSAAFLYVEFLDDNNTMLNLVGIEENTGSRLRAAAEENQADKRKEAILGNDIETYKGGYEDKAINTVKSIISERLNWPDIFAKINEVTTSVYELNDFFKYIEYNNYSFDADNKTVRVSGTLSDPSGRNLTKLVELEEAFKYYPKDKDNPDDPTKPYFSGFREFNSFSKTLDQATGRYVSSFQLSFSLNE